MKTISLILLIETDYLLEFGDEWVYHKILHLDQIETLREDEEIKIEWYQIDIDLMMSTSLTFMIQRDQTSMEKNISGNKHSSWLFRHVESISSFCSESASVGTVDQPLFNIFLYFYDWCAVIIHFDCKRFFFFCKLALFLILSCIFIIHALFSYISTVNDSIFLAALRFKIKSFLFSISLDLNSKGLFNLNFIRRFMSKGWVMKAFKIVLYYQDLIFLTNIDLKNFQDCVHNLI